MTSPVAVLWYRQDLRLADLPALHAASRNGQEVLPVYILDDEAAAEWAAGAASRWWLHHSLEALRADIRQRGGELILRRGDSARILAELCKARDATTVYCSRRYEPWAARQEQAVHDALAGQGIELVRHGGSLLHEPGTVLTRNGEPYKVFTPFWRACRAESIARPRPIPDIKWADAVESDTLESLQLTPRAPDWAAKWRELWTPGEEGASKRLNAFLESAVDSYGKRRDLPAEAGTSRLSPHLHHGELSPRQVWALCEQRKSEQGTSDANIEKFQSELGWREFSYHLLHFFPAITNTAFKSNFDDFPWSRSHAHLKSWQRGQTGYPIVDAGMRELWATGYMHNRVRMIVASFLCKHLLIDWREGEDWFWDTLVDADLASNSASWQWVAGSGADAAPYFRIFNPMTQGEKFDQEGAYVRRWVPELAQLPDKHLHTPWEAPPGVLAQAGVDLGGNYPKPIVDHRAARQAALDAYDTIKLSNASSS